MKALKNLYNCKYSGERWSMPNLRPDAVSTTAYDDIARLLRTEGRGGRGGKLCDMGCGSGKLAMALADQFDEVIGIDFSEIRIELANEKAKSFGFGGKVKFLTEDIESPLPFDNGYFDVVLLCAVLEHVVDVFMVMDEVARICKSGGCVIVSVPNICYIKHIYDLLLGRLPLTGIHTREISEWRKNGWDGGHLHYFSKASLDSLLRHIGFDPEEWTGDGKLAKLRRWATNLVGSLTVRARRR